MGRHSRPDRSGPDASTRWAHWHDRPADGATADDTSTPLADPGATSQTASSTGGGAVLTQPVAAEPVPVEPSAVRTSVGVHGARPTTGSAAGADETQVLPRVEPPHPPRAPALDPDATSVFSLPAGYDQSAHASDGLGATARREPLATDHLAHHDLTDADDPAHHDPTDAYDAYDAYDHAHHDEDVSRTQHRWIWLGLVVFWLLALGAGLVALTSLGARASCVGTDKSLDCTNTGSGIAIALTACVIVLVGIVSVHALEMRARPKRWLLDVGVGLVVLLAISLAAWRLIGTISGTN